MFKLDANHTEVKTAFLQLGCLVMDLAQAKHYTSDTLDLIVGIPNPSGQPGVNVLVEVKTEEGKVRPNQQRVITEWEEAGLPIAVVRSIDDVIAVFYKYREEVY